MFRWIRYALGGPGAARGTDGSIGPGDELSGRYAIEASIGSGGSGSVYRAWDRVLDLPVAVKILRERPGGTSGDVGADLRAEAAAAMRLTHPGIARVYTYDRDGDVEYLVMEYVDGVDLARHRRASPHRRLPFAEASRIVLDVLEALAVAHGAGVIHNDIKPANLMLTGDGGVKILDFGLARAMDARRARGATVAGTVAYMSPERFRNEAAGPASDLYSVGAVLFTLVDGRPPFGDAMPDAARGHLRAPVPPSDHLPAALHAVVARAMEKAPSDRYPSARAMADALIGALSGLSIDLPSGPSLAIAAEAREARVGPGDEPVDDEPVTEPLVPPVPRVGTADGSGESAAETLAFRESAAEPPEFPQAPVAPPPGMVRIAGRPVRLEGGAVDVPAFLLDRYPVTNADYARFVAETGELAPSWWNGRTPPPDRADHPVVGVTLEQARRFARWRGCRLPTTLEWISAARGPDDTAYPWGACCGGDATCHCPRSMPSATAPVDAHPGGASPEGVEDLLGNVWEWTERVPALCPPDPEDHYVLGASYRHPCTAASGTPMTTVHRSGEYLYLGFRCARDVAPGHA